MKYEITDVNSGDVFLCDEDESIFAAMIRSGKGPIRYGCGGGGCGVCKVKILEGEYQAFKNMSRAHVSEEEQKDGFVLSCCVKPCGSIKLTKV